MLLSRQKIRLSKTQAIFAAAVFLVSVPVFFQAPLVRQLPILSLAMTGGWAGLSYWLMSYPATRIWGELLTGFTWSWLAGSIYWGWLRWQPYVHLPIEAIGLPLALWGLWRNHCKVGNWFYIGSLFGTAVTDAYFYAVNLIPHWRQIMQVEPELALPIFQSAIAKVQTPWGVICAIVGVFVLVAVGVFPLQSQKNRSALHHWAFSGAVLSTIFVDGLFWLAACIT
ncbi:MAG: DUF3120 domain-containing protein [Oscillatoriaceae bacterium SKW80]|nr:DUF3120 domain-containing protein [Oscillatoriaceae bacterium SKYG93]MCX8119651.1 DUF3120 domain-containing protein [Oscillatoriaceae bacterium SKW80]MDW8455118.1 DUF3120 domain-containing protein [Oscillatoriaceae cyanobacterium SKYGB_i_bin93]